MLLHLWEQGRDFLGEMQLLSSLLIKSLCHMLLCRSYLWARFIPLACDKYHGVGCYTFVGRRHDALSPDFIGHEALTVLDFNLPAVPLCLLLYCDTLLSKFWHRILINGNLGESFFFRENTLEFPYLRQKVASTQETPHRLPQVQVVSHVLLQVSVYWEQWDRIIRRPSKQPPSIT